MHRHSARRPREAAGARSVAVDGAVVAAPFSLFPPQATPGPFTLSTKNQVTTIIQLLTVVITVRRVIIQTCCCAQIEEGAVLCRIPKSAVLSPRTSSIGALLESEGVGSGLVRYE